MSKIQIRLIFRALKYLVYWTAYTHDELERAKVLLNELEKEINA